MSGYLNFYAKHPALAALADAINQAGNAFHHTMDWQDNPEWFDGKTPNEYVQAAFDATDAALSPPSDCGGFALRELARKMARLLGRTQHLDIDNPGIFGNDWTPAQGEFMDEAAEVIREVYALGIGPTESPTNVPSESVELEVWTGDEFSEQFAQVSGPREVALAEARHYAGSCIEDGWPAQICEVRRTVIETISPTARLHGFDTHQWDTDVNGSHEDGTMCLRCHVRNDTAAAHQPCKPGFCSEEKP